VPGNADIPGSADVPVGMHNVRADEDVGVPRKAPLLMSTPARAAEANPATILTGMQVFRFLGCRRLGFTKKSSFFAQNQALIVFPDDTVCL